VATRTRVWRKGVLEKEDFAVERVSDYLEEKDTLVWVDLCVPDAAALQQVADELGLDPLAVEDALERHERPKIDRYPSHVFVTAYGLGMDGGVVRLSKVSAFLLPQALVTVRAEAFDVDAVTTAWDANPDLLEFGAHALLYGLLDVIVDGHLAVLQDLDDEVEEAEDDLFDERSRPNEIQRTTYQLRRNLTSVRKVAVPMRDVADALLRHHAGPDRQPDEMGERYRDLHDHVVRVNEWIDSLREMITTVFETGLALADTRLNQIVRKLSAWAAIIAVPTAVTGFYGQNVPYPGFGQQHGFLTSLVVTIVLAGGAYLGFRRSGWL
jgi:magnesium transporter